MVRPEIVESPTTASPTPTTGDLDQARHHWPQALTPYTALGVPAAEGIRAHLATLDQT